MEKNLNKRIIEVIDYDPNWEKKFENEKEALSKAIGSNAINIEHIGSTSVVGLEAKPIIDILIEVSSIQKLDLRNECIEELGYTSKGENGITGRRYFQKGGNLRSHHVHAFQTDDSHLHRHRVFKEYLIAHPAIASKYGSIKREAVSKSKNDMNNYMALKNTFIQKHQEIALEWFGNNTNRQ